MLRTTLISVVLLIGVLAVGVWYGTTRSAVPAITGQISVAATIFPLVDIVRQVGGEYIEVITLVPPGANEHSYALTTQQVAQVGRAKAIFAIGQKLDNHIVEPLARVHHIPIVTVEEGIALREYTSLHHNEAAAPHEEEEHGHRDSGIDPHYWLTVPNAMAMATTVANTLRELDPIHADQYAANLSDYLGELTSLEQELQAISVSAPQKHFIAMHNAWSYLAQHYGFELVATYEPVEGSQPSLQDLQELQTTIAQYKITTFFAEPQKVSSSAVRFLANEFGLTISTLDPIGGLDGNNSYSALMRANVTALSQAR